MENFEYALLDNSFSVSQEALLKKRKRDDENQRKRLDIRAKQRMDRGRKKK